MALGLEDKRIVITGGGGGLGSSVVDAFVAAGAVCYLPPLWASVHLAGGYAGGPFVDTTLEGFRRQLDMNVTTAFLCCREAVRSMRRGGGGRIVNVCSKAALVPSGGAVAYAVAKAGVAALTRSLAEEVKSENIFVNAVAPSIIDTIANRAAMPKADTSRWPKPSEIAKTILWLASPENGLTTGAVVPVYGSTEQYRVPGVPDAVEGGESDN